MSKNVLSFFNSLLQGIWKQNNIRDNCNNFNYEQYLQFLKQYLQFFVIMS